MSKREVKGLGVDGDVVEDILWLDVNEVYVPDDRERPLNKIKVKSLLDSIQRQGQLQPIIVDKLGNLLAGNHRLEACRLAGIKVKASVINEIDEDKLKLIEIDENLIRSELTPSQLEKHLAKRKEIYTRLFPETKQGGKAKGEGAKTFVEDTAEQTGIHPKAIQRSIRRGESASEELREARDNGEISTTDMDEIIKDTGKDHGAQAEKLKALLSTKKVPKEKPVVETRDNLPVDLEYYKGLEVERDSLKETLKEKDKELTKLNTLVSKLQNRIEKAKLANPELKI